MTSLGWSMLVRNWGTAFSSNGRDHESLGPPRAMKNGLSSALFLFFAALAPSGIAISPSCHPDRSAAQWRDLRFLSPRVAQVSPDRITQFDKPDLFRSPPSLQLFFPRKGVSYILVGFQQHETITMVGCSEAR
jgi:hypothetical protein